MVEKGAEEVEMGMGGLSLGRVRVEKRRLVRRGRRRKRGWERGREGGLGEGKRLGRERLGKEIKGGRGWEVGNGIERRGGRRRLWMGWRG